MESKKIMSIALIGLGRVAGKHLQAIRFLEKKNEVVLTSVVKRNIAEVEKTLKAYGFKNKIRAFTSMDEMLEQSPPDICAITTPSGSHFDQGRKALEANCHLLLEKPLTLDLDQADQLISLAEEKKLKIAVGHIYRYIIAIENIQKDLAAGRFGRILYASVTLRWGHDQAYYDQADWRGSWAKDGGVLMNQAVHALDLMSYLCQGLPVSANASLARIAHNIEAEDYAQGSLILAGGIPLAIEATTAGPADKREAQFFIQAEKGSIKAAIENGSYSFAIKLKDSRSPGLSYVRKGFSKMRKQYGLGGLKQITNPHTSIYLDLVDAVREGREPLAPGASGRDAVAMVLSLYQSFRENKTVSFPPSERKLTAVEIPDFRHK